MHRWILGAGGSLTTWLGGLGCALGLVCGSTLAAEGATPAPLTRCPGPGAAVIERFMDADCTGCWAATADGHAARREWLFDWIAPSAQGADAPMSAAAVQASTERAVRINLGLSVEAAKTQTHRSQLAARSRVQITVQSGPAWNGYFGLQMTIRGRSPAGATAWMALVEPLPAGTDGSGVARELMRSVAGPLPLPPQSATRPMTHLAALRSPESAQPERLRARAWIEAADGHILAVASDGCVIAAK